MIVQVIIHRTETVFVYRHGQHTVNEAIEFILRILARKVMSLTDLEDDIDHLVSGAEDDDCDTAYMHLASDSFYDLIDLMFIYGLIAE
jgi:hypothetical protein